MMGFTRLIGLMLVHALKDNMTSAYICVYFLPPSLPPRLTIMPGSPTLSTFPRCPPEVLYQMVYPLGLEDLKSACQAFKALYYVAAPILYSEVTVESTVQLRRMMRSVVSQNMTGHVKALKVYAGFWPCWRPLGGMHNLRVLELHIRCPRTLARVLGGITLPHLKVFISDMNVTDGRVLSEFLNRHATITNLTLLTQTTIALSNLIDLPMLQEYTGPANLLCSVVCTNSTLRRVELSWNELCDPRPALKVVANLAGITPLDISLTAEGLIPIVDLIAAVAMLLPNTTRLAVSMTEGTWGPTLIDLLAQLPALTCLVFSDAPWWVLGWRAGQNLIRQWAQVCPRLTSILLHGQQWELDDTWQPIRTTARFHIVERKFIEWLDTDEEA
ncbi:hypothetical protein B0H16DRAFT_1484480 [Mycena metata]|uniref:F-box domain-containing protein n=1 Tax=Mycena metata TaxID=1033252 RepID=A0AAD7GMV8_9AGAR|nr:hypothetical protein B0H16DRAFT_1484480 [Mycena metata]